MKNFKAIAFIVIGSILLLAGIYLAMDMSGASKSDLLDIDEEFTGRSPMRIVIAFLLGGVALIVTGLSERMRVIRANERTNRTLNS